MPKQWKRGTGSSSRSSGVNFMHSPIAKPLFTMLWCVSITPFGKPVVPEVYCMLITSWWCRVCRTSARRPSPVCSPSSSSSAVLNIPRCF